MQLDRRPKILAIDDDPIWLAQIPDILGDSCDVDGFETIDQGISALESQFYDIVLLDLNFPGDSRDGLEVFRRIHAADRHTDVIVISGETDHLRLIEIFNAGVAKFIPKMSSIDALREAVAQTLMDRDSRNRAHQHLIDRSKVPLIGESAVMQKLREDIALLVSAGTRDILIQGETGSGKELVAQAIAYHAAPSRSMIVVHCGAVAEGLVESEFFGHVKGAFTGADRDRLGAFEAASGGFVFLDEIGELPLSQQPKLLRVLQERKVQRVGTHAERSANFRCIAATHVNLPDAVKSGRFREDLYYRIAREVIRIPALRERTEDIPDLVHYFLAAISKKTMKTLTPEALRILQSYHWPGNVRQLRAVIESLCTRTTESVIRDKDILRVLPEAASVLTARATRTLVGTRVGAFGASLLLTERQKFEKAIIKSHGNRDAAAKLLGISRATFFRRAKDLGLVKSRGL